MNDVQVQFDYTNIESYRLFLKVKSLPRYSITGRVGSFPAEYASMVGIGENPTPFTSYAPIANLFDYQGDITAMALEKQKFAVFADCGLGKTLILTEFIRNVRRKLPADKRILIVSPLMVVKQTMCEAAKWYGDRLPIEQVASRDVAEWLKGRGGIGITNYEAFSGKQEMSQGNLGCLCLDESSMLKSHYGKWATRLIELGKGLDWKLCLTGTPAPNDRIEYANHAVFLDRFPNTNSFLARFFVNRGQTSERWEMKRYALKPFYRALSDWCIFLTNPATYGWQDNVDTIPPIHVHIHDVELTEAQRGVVHLAGGDMYGTPTGITSRAKLSQLAKGKFDGKRIATNKPEFIRNLVDSWPDESTIIWCVYNDEQDSIARMFPNAGNIDGRTPQDKREEIILAFQEGRTKQLITKTDILGFGQNLQVATRQVFSGLVDSYEDYYQAVKRSNRVGSTRPLNVHIPVTDVERPMIETVLVKAKRVQADAEEQERLFKEMANVAA